MEDKGPGTPKPDGSLEEGKQAGSPRMGFVQAQQGCSVCSRVFWELWRRIRLEVVVEWPLLKQRWKILLFGLVMQYVHGIFTQLAHRMHQPQEQPLHDVGFDLTPELGPEKHWVSETIFGIAFASFVLWTFTPFVSQRKRFYTAVMWSRLLMVLVVCQALRIVTFSVTQLPGPSFHCRAHEASARRPWPAHWSGHLMVDVGRQVSKSCGDLIFSSHTTFMLTGILAYNEYGSLALMKAMSWLLGVILSVLIVASRKHYTVDVVIAWYTVPLVFYTMYRRWTTRRPMSDFIGGSAMSAFDDVDGGELELEEVLIDRSSGMMGSMDTGGKAMGGAQPRPSTLKISVRAPQDGRHPSSFGGLGLGGHVLLGYAQSSLGLGTFSKDTDGGIGAKGDTSRGGQGSVGQATVVRNARTNAEVEWQSQQQHSSEPTDEGGLHATAATPQDLERWSPGGPPSISSPWFFAPNR
uniref:Sphingomyelin synthase-like domain-containing protein n=1 Tax=Yamagishiella unicocca TaxID=51707 RepID=A0A2Z5X8F4_9CHLO|nr:hypothetical protein, homolog of Volvox carteri MTF1733/MTM1058 [Yamagishiella unicocca]